NNWVGSSDPKVTCKKDVDIINILEETDVDVVALRAPVKVFKYSINKDDHAYFNDFLKVYKISQKINTYVVPVFVRCAVKSFLHLLQLY
ncbi:hypothetical protein, partial [Chryseobacterium sp.]|uniref:hypothetical protein n=1 Tax=Chryseobacterium sp. TaxID=1871047 RepID=UPI0025C3E515